VAKNKNWSSSTSSSYVRSSSSTNEGRRDCVGLGDEQRRGWRAFDEQEQGVDAGTTSRTPTILDGEQLRRTPVSSVLTMASEATASSFMERESRERVERFGRPGTSSTGSEREIYRETRAEEVSARERGERSPFNSNTRFNGVGFSTN
jgi:hypothetical protein